jgi:hypothetical protein
VRDTPFSVPSNCDFALRLDEYHNVLFILDSLLHITIFAPSIDDLEFSLRVYMKYGIAVILETIKNVNDVRNKHTVII